MPVIRTIVNFARPVQLMLALLSFWLGVGLARYLGATILPDSQIFGGLFVVFLMAASNLLTEYFRPFNEPLVLGETRAEREKLRSLLLVVSISFLGVGVFLVFLLQRAGFIQIDIAILLVLFGLLALANAVPPFRFTNRGFGGLSSAIQISSLSPTLAFLLQFGGLHRLLTIFTLPLFFLALAYFIALDFPSYADDLKYERRSFLVSLTWQRAIPLHNALLILAYLFFAAIPFLGVPIGLVWPVLLTLPLAAYQVFIMRGLSDGAKPIWPVFVAMSTAILGLSTYLVALTFWLH